MTCKVFLFDEDCWLYCSDVTFEYGVYHGWVINGNWHLMYDTANDGLFVCVSREHADSLVTVTNRRAKLTWACDPVRSLIDYNAVIAEAECRFLSGEPSNLSIKEIEVKSEEEEIPF